MPFEEFDHTADTGIKARGETLESFFTESFFGLYSVLGIDSKNVQSRSELTFELDAQPVDLLWVDWLSEILHRTQDEKWLFHTISPDFQSDVSLEQINQPKKTSLSLEASATGEVFDSSRHSFRTEIKGVTLHDLEISRTENGWSGQVIFDL